MYARNKGGPKTEPCGTSLMTEHAGEKALVNYNTQRSVS